MNEKQQKVEKLREMTGKGQLACDIALSLAHWDIDAAITRMRVSYPGLVVAGDEDKPRQEPPAPEPVEPPEDRDKKPWE